MGHLHGVFVESQSLPTAKGEWTLANDETSARAHLKALRLKNNDEVILLNGQGVHLKAKVQDSRKFIFSVGTHEHIFAPVPAIDVFLSPPKGADLDQAIQICVELGVRNLYLFKSEHSAHTTCPKLGRLNRIAQSSCEQSLNAWLPVITNLFEEKLSAIFETLPSAKKAIVFDEDLAGKNVFFSPQEKSNSYALFLGPEGGWSTKERQLFQKKNIERASLGPIVLKVPTALCAALSVIRSSAT